MTDQTDEFDLSELYAYGLSLPEAHTKSPWEGHSDLAVRDKTFAFISIWEGVLRVSCKLVETADVALTFPFVSRTGYGLGKSGWVTGSIQAGEAIPVQMFKAWMLESYKARAPKKLVALLPVE